MSGEEIVYIITYSDEGGRNSVKVTRWQYDKWRIQPPVDDSIQAIAVELIAAVNENEASIKTANNHSRIS